MKRPWPFIVLAIAAIVLAAEPLVTYVRRLNIPLLEPAGPIAAGELDVMILVAVFSSLVIIPVFLLLFYFAWKYRADAQNVHIHHAPDWDHDSSAIEFSWWFVPGVIVAILAIVAWRTSHTLDPYVPLPGSALTVEVIALDWKWLFLYPTKGVASVNELEIPVGRPIHFLLTADAPMNSFWIPQLGGQIMVMPGMSTQLYLEADTEGTYKGYSANISGEGFAGMAFDTHAVPQAAFDAWVSGAKNSPPLDYPLLSKPSTDSVPAVYTLGDSTLYDAVVMQYMMPRGSQATTTSAPVPATSTKTAASSSGMLSMPM